MPITQNADRQAECLRHIVKHFRSWEEYPTRSEIGRSMGIDKVSAHLLVKKLEADGLVLLLVGNGWRNLRVTRAGQAVADGVVPGFHDQEALRLRRGC